MSGYDPKLLEAWFRFLAEASRGQAQAERAAESLSRGSSPEAWAELSRGLLPWTDAAALQPWSERYLAALGLVPKRRYDELEHHNEELRRKLEEAERLLAAQAQGAAAREAVNAWQRTLDETLAAQRRWFSSWLGTADEGPEDEPDA